MLQQASAIERLIRPEEGNLSAELAAYFLRLDFAAQDRQRYQELSVKAQDGALNENEQEELDDLLTANDVLAILQSKARATMKRQNPAA